MKKNFILLLISSLLCGAGAMGCGSEDDPADGDNDGSDTPSDGDNSSDGNNSDTGQPLACELDVLETFDSAVPVGWTVLGGGSGSGSGSGSGTDVTAGVDPETTWHHTSVDTAEFPLEGLSGGYVFVGGTAGMNEALVTDFYPVGTCSTVTLSFTHYFDDFRGDLDRGEVWFIGDAPPWSKIATYSTNADKKAVTETIDLSQYVAGQSLFQVKFVFADDNQGNYGWGIDDVDISGAE